MFATRQVYQIIQLHKEVKHFLNLNNNKLW